MSSTSLQTGSIKFHSKKGIANDGNAEKMERLQKHFKKVTVPPPLPFCQVLFKFQSNLNGSCSRASTITPPATSISNYGIHAPSPFASLTSLSSPRFRTLRNFAHHVCMLGKAICSASPLLPVRLLLTFVDLKTPSTHWRSQH